MNIALTNEQFEKMLEKVSSLSIADVSKGNKKTIKVTTAGTEPVTSMTPTTSAAGEFFRSCDTDKLKLLRHDLNMTCDFKPSTLSDKESFVKVLKSKSLNTLETAMEGLGIQLVGASSRERMAIAIVDNITSK